MDDESPIMLSALQHYSYCPRPCALIHQQQGFDENAFTLHGQRTHRRIDSGEIGIEAQMSFPRRSPSGVD